MAEIVEIILQNKVIFVIIAIAMLEGVLVTMLMRNQNYDWGSFFCSTGDFVGRIIIFEGILFFNFVLPLIAFAWDNRIFTIEITNAAAIVALLIAQEFSYYWYHRASHRVRWFWASHMPHHSTNDLNLSAAYRFGWTTVWSGNNIFYVPLVWLGFSPKAIFGMLFINLGYQFFIHTKWIGRLGPVELVFNTPTHHRIHHAANTEYLDGNYGGILIVFDRIFGTFISEREDTEIRYGLTTPLFSNNPVVVAFSEWWALGRDVLQARSAKEVALYVFGPPGWKPDGRGATTSDLRRAMTAVPSARPGAPDNVKSDSA